jgi:hypothetical protein
LLAVVSIGVAIEAPAQTQNPNQPNPRNTPTPTVHRFTPPSPQRIQTAGLTITYLGWRSGYSPYPGLTIRRVFSFHRYIFDYSEDTPVLLSPFYLYPNLPPFIADPNPAQDSLAAQSSDSNPPAPVAQTASDPASAPTDPSATSDPASMVEPDSDLAVLDLKHLWESPDSALIDKLCPTAGKVTVSVLDQTFPLEARDFRDLLKDGTLGTHTIKWTILDEHVEGDSVELKARHQFLDAAGKTRSISQIYTLVKEKNGYVIREFGSDRYEDKLSN